MPFLSLNKDPERECTLGCTGALRGCILAGVSEVGLESSGGVLEEDCRLLGEWDVLGRTCAVGLT